jgi:alkaline phosphatase
MLAMRRWLTFFWAALLAAGVPVAEAETRIRIMPPDRSTFAVGQRFDIRVEATSSDVGQAPRGLRVFVDGVDVTARNILDAAADGERGGRGSGATAAAIAANKRADSAPAHTTNFLVRDFSFAKDGRHTIEARSADGATASVAMEALAWEGARSSVARARNIILLLGDGMGIAQRTAARIVSRGYADGRPKEPLAMDTMPVTGQVMTSSLNAILTDSAPGMSCYVTGNKANNNQEGVFPDNTPDDFDNPRVEYIGEMLRRVRGAGFNVGIVTTADVTDATPAANAVHTADRSVAAAIAQRFFDERAANGVTVLMGGGSRNFTGRQDERDLVAEFQGAGFTTVTNATELAAQLAVSAPPAAVLGLFAPSHLPVAFDKVGAGRYSDELADAKNSGVRDAPRLDAMSRLAIAALSSHSPKGFYLMIEGASIDKQAHQADAERMVWDTIEFDNAIRVALEFARRTNTDGVPGNDTLVIVTADHETGGLGLVGVGNALYAPQKLGRAVRDYSAVFRFDDEQVLNFYTNYQADTEGYPVDPDPSRKLLLGWAAAPDRFENWISNRRADKVANGATTVPRPGAASYPPAAANPRRDSAEAGADNRTVQGQQVPGFKVEGVIENGAFACADRSVCPGDTSSIALDITGHTASDVVLSAAGAGAAQFTGTFDNTAVFIKMLRATSGAYDDRIR